MTKARGGGAAADVPLPWRGCDASREAVVNVVNQTSTLVPAVLGGVLYAAVLGRDSITFALDS